MSLSEHLEGTSEHHTYHSDLRELTYTDYTVGWICALPCEVTAARAMFDEEHATLAGASGDNNVYSLGSIAGHNVVVANLPMGMYGTRSTTTVVNHMLATFRSISIPLLVGVGGGVPTEDIRLGDVVVSVPQGGNPAVLQYDYGKMLADGKIKHTGHLNNPATQMLAAVANLRGRHEMSNSMMFEIMEEALSNGTLVQNGYVYPGSHADVLNEQDCIHSTDNIECTKCQHTVITREPRDNSSPVIHFGCIASGNQVIKNSKVRDGLALSNSVLCFEMEAAGLPDHFPALVIRGISDYCDNNKHKTFQRYAALAAAAYAKELLSTISTSRQVTTVLHESMTKHERKLASIVQSFNFGDSATRLLTIHDPHSDTLQWFSQHKTYLEWLDHSQMQTHRGFLWIKGKPGAGKSTLMKFALSRVKGPFTISFFFNARGSELQRTTLGMYRSFLFQLLTQFSYLGDLLHLTNLIDPIGTLEVIKSIFKAAICQIQEPVICFIDALDESTEDEIRDLIAHLEMVIEHTASTGLFRVCCSSRYYPLISVRVGLELLLDKEDGHTKDIANYIHSMLRIGDSNEANLLKAEMVKKSAGVFLWVVLVVQMLKKEYDRGRLHAIRRKLSKTPTGLNDLFRDMLLRDNDNIDELIFCIQWILYSERPLTTPEFYHGLLASDFENELEPLNHDYITRKDMARYIISSSKGLVEETYRERIQVIHESVREYLHSGAMLEISPAFRAINLATGHAHLATCCFRYIELAASSNMVEKDTAVLEYLIPLLRYATKYTLQHAEIALLSGEPQIPFLRILFRDQSNNFTRVLFMDIWGKSTGPTYLSGRGLGALLALKNLPLLLKIYQSDTATDPFLLSHAKSADLFRAIEDGFLDVGKVSLHPIPEYDTRPNSVDDVSQNLSHRSEESKRHYKRRSFLRFLLLEAPANLVKVFLDCEAWVTLQDEADLFRVASARGFAEEFLRKKISLQDLSQTQKQQYLYGAVASRNIDAIERCLLLGAQPNIQHNSNAETPIMLAVLKNWPVAVKRFLQQYKNVNEIWSIDSQSSLLHEACRNRGSQITQMLLVAGADPLALDNKQMTPLHLAVRSGEEAIVKKLIEYGANVNARNVYGETPLYLARKEGSIFKLLYSRLTVWQGASYRVQGLVDYGASFVSNIPKLV